jgi:hypothetical protein
VTEGVFPETLPLADGVSVYGGYDASWQRSPSNITKLTGTSAASDAVVATGIIEPTTVQLVTLEPSPPTSAGANSYGLRGAGSPGPVLDHVTIAAPGAAAARGANGAHGVDGIDGSTNDTGTGHGGVGGAGQAGRSGGRGGDGGNGVAGETADAQGLSTSPDAWGENGRAGGRAGVNASNPLPGWTGTRRRLWPLRSRGRRRWDGQRRDSELRNLAH